MKTNCDKIFSVCPSGMADELCITCKQGRLIAELENEITHLVAEAEETRIYWMKATYDLSQASKCTHGFHVLNCGACRPKGVTV